MKVRDEMQKKAINSKSQGDWRAFKRMKNDTNRKVKDEKEL